VLSFPDVEHLAPVHFNLPEPGFRSSLSSQMQPSVASGYPSKIDDAVAAIAGFDFESLRPEDIVGRLPPIEYAQARLLAGLLRSATLHGYFLADLPGASAVGELDIDRSPPDSFRLGDREIYLHLPKGMARTKLTNAYFDSKLSTTSKARNWATVVGIFEMMREYHYREQVSRRVSTRQARVPALRV
jgi:hypothetical protein